MSTQTEHIGLHQWESTDPFLREDFNEDNRKIDQAVEAVEKQTRQTADSLENMSYNVFNLLLQNYYEGKYTGYKKALVFDGFMDNKMIQTHSDSITLHSNRLIVNAAGQENLIVEAGSEWIQSGTSPAVAAGGGGSIYGIVVSFLNETGNKQPVPCQVYCAARQVVSFTFQVPTGATQQTFELEEEFSVSEGDQLSIQLTGLNSQLMAKGGKISTYQLAVTFLCRSSAGSTGQMMTVPFALPGGTVQVWLRHKDCSVALALDSTDGKHLPLTVSSAESAWNLQREACTETVFTLEQLCMEGDYTLSMEITRTGKDDGLVYDYGLLCI